MTNRIRPNPVGLNHDRIMVTKRHAHSNNGTDQDKGRLMKKVVIAAALMLAAAYAPALAAERATHDDAARYLAGLPLSANSPIAKLTQHAEWQQHAKHFDTAWRDLDQRQLSKIRTWSGQHLKDPQATLYYMFSGPDFLYAHAFFPKATTYVMSGLEAVGRIPDVAERGHQGLPSLRASLNSSLAFSFFISQDMRGRISAGSLSGTLPILYVFVARAGNTIHDASLISLDEEGVVHPAGQGNQRNASPGAKIEFSSGGGPRQTLYYFRTDLSDSGVKNSGFLKFCDKLGQGDAFLKSTSYLIGSGNFNKVRDFVLERSQAIVQDDFGIPVAAFKPEQWTLSAVRKISRTDQYFPEQIPATAAGSSRQGGEAARFRHRLSLAHARIQRAAGRAQEAAGGRRAVTIRALRMPERAPFLLPIIANLPD